MADRAHYLQQMVDLVGNLIEDGFTREEIGEMFSATLAHLEGPGEVPYAPEAPASTAAPFTSRGASTSGR